MLKIIKRLVKLNLMKNSLHASYRAISEELSQLESLQQNALKALQNIEKEIESLEKMLKESHQ